MAPDRELPEREQRVVELLAQARTGARAPDSLRVGVAALSHHHSSLPRRLLHWSTDLGVVVASLVAVIVLGVVLLTRGPSRRATQADVLALASFATRSATGPAPAPDRAHPATLLRASVAGLPFPNWQANGGWRASGVRTDAIDGRRVVTVYYRHGAQRLAYSVAAPPAFPWTARPGRYVSLTFPRASTWAGGTRSGQTRDRHTVVWWYEGHTCSLSAVGISAGSLWQLAATTFS